MFDILVKVRLAQNIFDLAPNFQISNVVTFQHQIQYQIAYDVAPNLSSKKGPPGTKFNMIQHQNNIIQHQFSGDIFVI